MHVEVGQRALRQVVEGDHELAGLRVGRDRAGQLDVGGEAVGDEEDPVAVAGLRFAEVDEAGQRARAGPSCRSRGCRPWRTRGSALLRVVPKLRFGVGAGGLAVGGVGVDREARRQGDGGAACSSDGDGIVGLCCCGTVRSTSMPEAESVSVVVGWAQRLGLKLSWSQPVVCGQGVSACVVPPS